jgi:cell division protein FtsB
VFLVVRVSPSDGIQEPKESWHLSKSVPVTLILAILVNTGGTFWWASNLATQVSHNTFTIAELKAYDKVVSDNDRKTVEVLARLEERLAAQVRVLERMEARFTEQR